MWGRRLSWSRADALMFLDGDDWLAPAALGLLAETLENASWAAAAVGRYARVDSNAVARLSPPRRGGDCWSGC